MSFRCQLRTAAAAVGLSLALGIAGCASAEEERVASPTGQTADLVLHHGKIVTVDDEIGEVQAIAVKGDRILAVGSNENIARYIGDDTSVIDLQGKTAIPGFIEGHGHFTGVGELIQNLDLLNIESWDDALLNDRGDL